MKIIISRHKLEEIDTFSEGEPQVVDIVNGFNGLTEFLSFKAHELGYSSVNALLEREKHYMYTISIGKRIRMGGLQ